MKYHNTVRFTESVVRATQDVTLQRLQAFGTTAESWDEFRKAPDYLADIFDGTMTIVDYNEAATILPSPILGASNITIRTSETPLLYFEQHSAEKAKKDFHGFLIDVVDVPLKHVEIELANTVAGDSPAQKGRIYLTPDSMPVAVHDDDVQYVMDCNKDICLEYDDTRIVGIVARSFGPDAVNYLTDAQCGALYQSVRTAKITPAKFL